SREQQRPKVMAIIGIAIGFSFYIALLIGPVIADRYGLHGIFAITGVLAILCIPLVIWVVPSAINYAPKGDTLPVLTDVKTLFFDPQLRRLNISVLLLHMMITVLFVQMPILLSALGWQLERHWQLYLPILSASVVGLIALMVLTKKMSQAAVIRLCILLLGGALIGLHFAHGTVLAVMIFGWLFFTGFNFLEASFPALVSSIAPAGKKGSAMGIYASFQFLGAFLGGTLSGLASEFIGAQWVFVIAGGVCAVWWFGLRKLDGRERMKRYTLKPDFTRYSAQTIGEQLATLEGVVDVTVVPDEGVVYIKADGKVFVLDKAQILVNG
ncbi:MAG: MFS transporter, partial [Paraglaciecola polaris]